MPKLCRVALLGAGHIGQTIARLLGDSGDYAVTVIDRSPAALARVVGTQVSTCCADTEDGAALLAALRTGAGHGIVVNALPYHLAVATAMRAGARLHRHRRPPPDQGLRHPV
jgi:saccharopine dehydrogenase-like NADP-dependent oxidoreductase